MEEGQLKCKTYCEVHTLKYGHTQKLFVKSCFLRKYSIFKFKKINNNLSDNMTEYILF